MIWLFVCSVYNRRGWARHGPGTGKRGERSGCGCCAANTACRSRPRLSARRLFRALGFGLALAASASSLSATTLILDGLLERAGERLRLVCAREAEKSRVLGAMQIGPGVLGSHVVPGLVLVTQRFVDRVTFHLCTFRLPEPNALFFCSRVAVVQPCLFQKTGLRIPRGGRNLYHES